MAFQSVPETAEIVIRYFANAEAMVNTLHGRQPGGYTFASLSALALAVDAAVALAWLPIQTADASYVSTTVRGLEFENDLEVINNASAGPGTDPVQGLPGNVTFSVKKASGLTGRSARGRLYWMGMPRDNLSTNENLLLVAARVAIVAAIETLRTTIDGTIFDPVIVSRFSGGVQRPTGVTFPWLTTVAVNDEVDSQRGRLIS